MRLLVLGGGISGKAAARLALRQGDEPVIWEQASAAAAEVEAAGLAVVKGEWSRELLNGFEAVVTSPGLAERSEPIVDALASGVLLMSEVEYASKAITAPIVAVTGTNGKTTVTALTAAILEESGQRVVAAGNIGLALSDIADQDWDCVVVEMSSFQLRFIDTFAPAVSLVLNIADDHLDWHGSQAAYAAAKARIVENHGAADVLVFNCDDAGATAVARLTAGRTYGVSGVAAASDAYGVRGGHLVTLHQAIPLADLQVDDAAYRMDLAASAIAAETMGATAQAVRNQLTTFLPAQHRRTVIGTWSDVTWVNDSKATNPHAAVAAVAAYPSVVLIAGGRNKGLDLAPLATAPTVKAIVVIGEAAAEISRDAIVPTFIAYSLDAAIIQAAEIAGPGDTVLLAPGCASFDMFTDYIERGVAFEAAVRSFQGVPA